MNSGSRIHWYAAWTTLFDYTSAFVGRLMSLEWFHAMLGAFFVGVWLMVGQIVAMDRR